MPAAFPHRLLLTHVTHTHTSVLQTVEGGLKVHTGLWGDVIRAVACVDVSVSVSEAER